ncbi:Uncharacterised protein [Mycobacteroides abscessus subsp. abscessus]|nr:Uncharacterised protein [Mycobacteroides abscessus subsp. abscessus]
MDSNCIAAVTACWYSVIRSGCFTFHLPDICSTTSLESIETLTSVAPRRAASANPAIRPRYSATLLVAWPMASQASPNTVW